jgi:hypothetical protein
MTNDPFGFDDLEDHVDAQGNFTPELKNSTGKDAKVVRFPCQVCGGTGEYQGARVHQHKSHCFACRGKGFFLTSERERQQARATARSSKAAKLKAAREAFDEEHPGLASFLAKAGEWSGFAASLSESITKYGSLTDKQTSSALGMQAKCAKRDEERQAAKATRLLQEKAVDASAPEFAPLAEGFLSAAANIKWPKLRLLTASAAPVVLSRCGDQSRTPGHINVTDGGPYGDNVYYGRITPEGHGHLRQPIPAEVAAVLAEFNRDPKEAVKLQGERSRELLQIKTGQCCCCGRELTDPVSVERGIGPICADRWGW